MGNQADAEDSLQNIYLTVPSVSQPSRRNWFQRLRIFPRVEPNTPSTMSSPLSGGESEQSEPSFANFVRSTGRKPTISALVSYQEQYGKDDAEIITFNQSRSSTPQEEDEVERFGWIKGVLIRCVLCIFGATLFLRMSWMGGQAGIGLSAAIMLLSLIIVIHTAISMSAIATNGQIRNGGLYYLISRSLGPEFGGSIGLILYVANTINASMNCVGLAETIVDILNGYGFRLIDGGINDVRLYGIAACLILQMIIFIGTEFENKTQLVLMVTIAGAIVNQLVGSFLPVSEVQMTHGLVGYQWQNLYDNFWPNFRNGESFITVFGIYFPAMTGIIAGANMSGDLKDPSASIPKGTLWGIGITTAVYFIGMLVPSLSAVRDADGVTMAMINGTVVQPNCIGDCKYGLSNDFQLAVLQGAWPPLIIAGIISTTLSSASGCLIGGPRVFQALCEDKLFPLIEFFAKGHGKTNDPFRAYFLTCFLAICGILIGDLNAIATLITNFYLAAFAITNFACFDASAANSPGFRPGFRYYNKYSSLFGSLMCVGVMFMLSWQTSLVTFIIFSLMFIYIKNNKSHINWGSSTEANRYRKALISLLKVTRTADHVKNFRPQLLVLIGNPVARQPLVDFANCITKGQNLMVCGHVMPCESDVRATATIRKLSSKFDEWLRKRHVKAFYCGVASTSLRAGCQHLLQTVGLGKMQPNILMLGYKTRWVEMLSENSNHFEDYTGLISDAFESNLSICIFRNENYGLDHSARLVAEEDRMMLSCISLNLSVEKLSGLLDDHSRGLEPPRLHRPRSSPYTLARSRSDRGLAQFAHFFKGERRKSNEELPTQQQEPVDDNRFGRHLKKGVVDVWWLFDDGGLELLLAYLLTTSGSYLSGAVLRVFTICSSTHDRSRVRSDLIEVLRKFRINFSEVIVLVDECKEFYQETVGEYDEIVRAIEANGGTLDELLLTKYADRTRKQMRHRELLLQYSMVSSLIIITLPLAPSALITSPLYMFWLELLSKDMPPTLFVRGNQTSALTFYS